MLSGRYRIEHALGTGAQGEVVAAVDAWYGDRPVAVKRVSPAAAVPLQREFTALKSLVHPGIVAALDFGSHGGDAFLVEERIDGEPLADWASRRDPTAICRHLTSVAHAVAHLHVRGLVHLDISPRNIMIEHAAEPRAVLIDLGLARPIGDAGASGTPGFVAPELLLGEPATPAADVYSLGATIAAVLGDGTSQGWGAPDLTHVEPAPLRNLLAECLAEAPGSRPSALQLALGLATIAGAQLALLDRPLTRLPLCGRADALAAFDTWLAEGRGAFVVSAQPGLGTTAFLIEAADRARAEGILVLEAVGGVPGGAARLLARTVSSSADDASLLTNLGAELADIVDDGRLPAPAGRAQSDVEIAQLLVLAVDALHSDKPTLVVVDDALEAAGPLAAAVEIWRRRRTESGARVAIASGPSRASSDEGVTLEPLGIEAIDRMLALAYAKQRPRAEAEHLLALCGGAPAAILRALEAVATRGCGVLELEATALGDETVPELPAALRPLAGSSGAVAAATLEVLLPDTDQRRAILRAASLAGVLTVEAHGSGPRFAVPARVRRQVKLDKAEYRRLAEAIEGAGEPLAAAGPWALAGDVARACDALDAGGAPASARLAAFIAVGDAVGASVLDDGLLATWARLSAAAGNVVAARRAVRELEARGAGRSANLHLASALVRAGQYREALVTLGEQAADASSTAVRARALLFAGHAQQAREVAASSWKTATGAARAELLDVLGHAAFQSGDVDAALEALRRALDEAVAAGDAEAIGRAHHGLAIVLQRRGERQEALRAYRASLEVAGPLSRLVRTRNLATLLQDLGELVEARACYRDALSGAVALANVREQAHVGVNLANLEVLLGELAVATALAETTVDLCEQHDLGHAAAMAALVLAEASVERRDLEAAGRALRRAAGHLEAIEDPTATAELTLLSARLAAAKHDGETGLANLEAVEPRGAAEHIPRQLAYWRARLRLEVGGAPDQAAVELAERAVSVARSSGDTELTWRALAVLARVHDRREADGDNSARDEARAAMDAFLAPLPDDLRTSYLSCHSRRELAAWLRPARREDAGVPTSGIGLAAYRRLLAINRRLAREQAVDTLLELIVDTAIELLGAERGFLILREGETVRIAVARNFDKRSLEDGRQRISRSIASEVLRVGEAVLTTNAQEDQRFAGIASVATLKVRSVICAPLRGTARDDDPVIGALYLDHRFQDRAFTEEDVSLCRAFADQAAIALENARLLEQTREQERRLQTQNERLERLNAGLRREVADSAAEAEAALRRLREEGPLVGVGRGFERIVGRSDKLREALRLVDRFADTDVPVFISGESGTGKELVARAIHERSGRVSRAFVSINCGAIPENLIESELFGYEKGAFTGAVRNKAGLFAAAEGGTLLLDEIGEMPLTMQVKLLRVLQEKEFRPVGATRNHRADVRILSASHRDLEELVSQGAFREDLLYRLRVVEVGVPPLRDRRGDIPLLVDHFCREITGMQASDRFTKEALARLMGHDWPGNVRELDNEVRRALALADGVVGLEDLSERLRGARSIRAGMLADGSRGSLKEIIDGFEREVLLATLARTGWNVRQTAKELGLSRAALYTRLNRFGITREMKS